MSAIVPVFFPVALMATLHQWLGVGGELGEFPNAPITIYLARSTSLLYAMHGAVMFYVAWQFDRCQLLVPLLGCLLYTSPSPRDKRQSRMPSSA